MILHQDGAVEIDNDFSVYSFGDEKHYVHGLIYLPGIPSGQEAVNYVYRCFKETGEIPFKKLFGAFTYIIQLANKELYAFSDNSNLHCLYVSAIAISSHYLPLMRYYREHNLHLSFNVDSLCEYYTLGNIFFGKTHVNEIAILPNDKYICIKDGESSILSKGIGDISVSSTISDPQEFFDELAESLRECSVCQALTGGYDSRMVFACMSNTKQTPQPFLSMNNADDIELAVSRKVAAVQGKLVTTIRTEKPKLTDELIHELIWQNDGMYPLNLEADFRIANFKHVMAAQGYNIQLTGDGGVLHKDWEWMQDLPFYHRKSTDLQRFYRQRIAYSVASTALGPRLEVSFHTQEKRFLAMLQPYVKETNTQSYDALYCYVSGNRRIYYNTNYPSYIPYAPLEELELVRYSYHLPRRKRFFYNSMREITSNANREIARIPTNYGTTASSEVQYLLRDVFFQSLDYFKKACRMTSRVLFKKSVFVGKVLDWSFQDELTALPLVKKAVQWAVLAEILAPKTTVHVLKHLQLQRILHLYLLAEKYQIN